MMRIPAIALVCGLVLALGGSASAQVPDAEFSGAPLSGDAPLFVAFTDLSTGTVATWDWDFGDTNTSTDQNPTHTYALAGTYTVVLTVDGASGSDTETKVDYITVTEPAPVAEFSANKLVGDVVLIVDFSDLSSGAITSYAWDFGDGFGTSTLQNPSYAYTMIGTFTVELTVTGPGGVDTETKLGYIQVDPLPVAEFSGTPTSGSAPLQVSFSDLSTGNVTSWSWDFGDGNTSTEQSPSHTYTTVGAHTVELTVDSVDNSDTETKTDYITSTAQPPVSDFDATPVSGQVPLLVQFNDLSTSGGPVTSWLWDFGDGGLSTDQNPAYFYTAIGVYTVSLTVTGPGGMDTFTRTDYIAVNPASNQANFGFEPLPNPVLKVSPTALDFGAARVGALSPLQTFQITNTSPGPIQLIDFPLLGAGAGDFLLTLGGGVPPFPNVLPPGASLTFEVTAAPTGKGVRRAVFNLLTDADPGLTRIVQVRTTGVGPVGSEHLINVGGPSYVDAQAEEWVPDFGFSGGAQGGVVIPIGATNDPVLYQTRRTGPAFAYSLPMLDPGGYVVRLHFVEVEFPFKGARLMDVFAEGNLVLDDLDIFAESGLNTAHVETLSAIVTDGALDLSFVGAFNNAILSAIEIRGIPFLTATPEGIDFGAVAEGSSDTRPLVLSNDGIQNLTIDTISFFLGGSGSPDSYSVDIGGTIYDGQPTNTSYSVNLPLTVGSMLQADVTFAPTSEQYDSVILQFSGGFGAVNVPLTGLGGHEGDPYLHVVIEAPDVVVDYDDDGFADVTLDGTQSHTHEPGQVLVGYEWSESGVPFSTNPMTVASLALGVHDITLEITDDTVPGDSLDDDAAVDVRAKTDVPGVLARYYDASGSSATALLDNVPAFADFAEVVETVLIEGQTSVGGSFFTGDVMVRINVTLTLNQSGTYTFIPIGGVDRRLELAGAPITGPIALAAGPHAFEARFAVNDLTNMPLGIFLELGGVPFDPGAVTHDQSALQPVINSMPSAGTSLGGNFISIQGLGYFPDGSVTVHWGALDLTQTDFMAQTPSSIDFSSPPGAEGVISVTVETPLGSSNPKLFTYSASGPVPIDFVHNKTYSSPQPTTGVWGPDGRFYVASLDGRVKAFEFDEDYGLVNETIYPGVSSLINDDTLGLAISPFDPADPVRLYVGHGQHFVNGGDGNPGFSPYTGQISILEGPNFDTPIPLITKLPVSNHDHAVNGITFNNNGDMLFLVGSNTNAGVPHPNSGGLPESPLSAAMLVAKIYEPGFNGNIVYLETATGVQSSDQRDGEIVDVAPGVDVHVYAPGLRNPYDLVYTTRRRVYATDNGPNNGFGAASTGPTTEDPDPLEPDELLLVEPDLYFGSPNRSRGRYDPRQNVYRDPNGPSIADDFQQHIAILGSSTNGIDEYRSDTFGGQIRGELVVQKWISFISRVRLTDDGSHLVSFLNVNPWTGALSVRTGPGGVLMGMDLGNNELKVLEPDDTTAAGLVVHDITPWRALASGGYPFVIAGTGFGNLGNTSVTIGGLSATVTAVTPKRISGTVPANPTPSTSLVDVVVTVSGSSDVHEKAFRFLFPPGGEPGVWQDLPGLVAPIGEVASGEIDGFLYTVGEGSAQTVKYDLVNRFYLPNAAVRPNVGHHHAAEVVDGKLYLIGGLGGGSDGKVQIYDPVSDSWSLGANMPWAGGSVSTALIGGKIYATGGIVSIFTVNNTAVYDPVLNMWTSLAVMPDGGRNHAAGGTDGNRLYVFGGRKGCNCVTNGFDDTFVYDPATNTWDWSGSPGSSLVPLPQRRGGMGRAVYYQGELYVFGGETQTGAGAIPGTNVYDRVDVYDPSANSWRLDEPMPNPRHGIYPVLFQNRVYLMGGGVMAGNSQSVLFDNFRRE